LQFKKIFSIIALFTKSMKPKIVSLFAGVGGIDLGFKQAGFEISFANEIDEKPCKTYNANFSHNVTCENVKNISIPKTDVLTAGFPCQAFSIAGQRKGFEDERGSVFFEVLRLIKETNPRIIMLENVKNLVSHDKGETFKFIKEELEKLDYKIKYKVLNTAEYSNLPQNRERIYILCFKEERDFHNFFFPEKTSETLRLKDILENDVEEKFYYNKTKYYPLLKETMKNYNTFYQWRRQYVRENKSELCPTLTANMGTGGHNVPLIHDGKDIRKLTPRECFRLQGFPDTFILPKDLPISALYKQAGNSVSVPVIQKIAENIMKVLV
jgi:DNA (cytosine-5)-methyltransferase 1